MRIALAAVAGTLGGPATYGFELASALNSEFPADELTVFTDRPDMFPEQLRTVRIPLPSPWAQPLWDHFGLPLRLAGAGYDVFHATKGILPRILFMPAVVTVHDLAFRTMPETFSGAQRLHLSLETPATLRRAQAVITDSESSASDLRGFYPAVKDRVTVVPLGVPSPAREAGREEVDRWRRARGIEGPAVGYLGTLQPRKNLDLLAEAFLLAAGDRDWRLLLAGRLRPGYRPKCLKRGDRRISYLGPIANDEVAAFLGSLNCMVSPSSYEGFGLSMLEAMASGCPVVGLDNSSVREVVGDAGILLDSADLRALAATIGRVVDDAGLALDLKQRGLRRAALFTWKATARRTHEIYEGLVGGSPRP